MRIKKKATLVLPDGEIMYLGNNSLYKAIKKGFELQKLLQMKLKIKLGGSI